MKATLVTVRFAHGLHTRPAANLVQLFKRFRARTILRLGNRVASAGKHLSILLLAATAGTQLEVQAPGEDEEAAVRAAEVFFQSDDETAVQQFEGEPSPDERPATNP